jgi:hypothetical protein
MSEHPCKVPGCGTVDADKPMAFRQTDACCELHRKMLDGELPLPTQTDAPPGKGGVSNTRSF